MCTMLDDTVFLGISVTSIEVPELAFIRAAIKNPTEANLKWYSVTSLLIEESKALCHRTIRSRAADTSSSVVSSLRHRPVPRIKGSLFNPLNPENRLKLTDKSKFRIRNGNKKKNNKSKIDNISSTKNSNYPAPIEDNNDNPDL